MTNNNRLPLTVSISLAAILSWAAIISSDALAQDAQPGAAGGEVVAVPGAPPAEARPAHTPPQSRFLWVIHSSGVIGAVILGLSIYFVATVIRLFIELRPEMAMPAEEVAHCE